MQSEGKVGIISYKLETDEYENGSGATAFARIVSQSNLIVGRRVIGKRAVLRQATTQCGLKESLAYLIMIMSKLHISLIN